MGLTYGMAAYVILRVPFTWASRSSSANLSQLHDYRRRIARRPRQPRADPARFNSSPPFQRRLAGGRPVGSAKLVAHDSSVRLQLSLSHRSVSTLYLFPVPAVHQSAPRQENAAIGQIRPDDDVCLLCSFINPVHEAQIRNLIKTLYPSLYVAMGSAVRWRQRSEPRRPRAG